MDSARSRRRRRATYNGGIAVSTTGIPNRGRLLAAALIGLSVGVLGGLIGLGGAEFRLPLLALGDPRPVGDQGLAAPLIGCRR